MSSPPSRPNGCTTRTSGNIGTAAERPSGVSLHDVVRSESVGENGGADDEVNLDSPT
jgi:hypothetical protein